MVRFVLSAPSQLQSPRPDGSLHLSSLPCLWETTCSCVNWWPGATKRLHKASLCANNPWLNRLSPVTTQTTDTHKNWAIKPHFLIGSFGLIPSWGEVQRQNSVCTHTRASLTTRHWFVTTLCLFVDFFEWRSQPSAPSFRRRTPVPHKHTVDSQLGRERVSWWRHRKGQWNTSMTLHNSMHIQMTVLT